jgi:hypothetical protein
MAHSPHESSQASVRSVYINRLLRNTLSVSRGRCANGTTGTMHSSIATRRLAKGEVLSSIVPATSISRTRIMRSTWVSILAACALSTGCHTATDGAVPHAAKQPHAASVPTACSEKVRAASECFARAGLNTQFSEGLVRIFRPSGWVGYQVSIEDLDRYSVGVTVNRTMVDGGDIGVPIQLLLSCSPGHLDPVEVTNILSEDGPYTGGATAGSVRVWWRSRLGNFTLRVSDRC